MKGNATMTQSTSKLRKMREGHVMREQYIVVLKDDIDSEKVSAVADELARAHHGSVMHVYKSAIKGFCIKIAEKEVLALSGDSRVQYMEEDGMVTAKAGFSCLASSPSPIISPQQPAPWHLDRIDQQLLPLNGEYTFKYDGTGVNVYLIDGGIFVGHSEFLNKQNTASRASFALKAGGLIFDAADDAAVARGRDFGGHGTPVGSLIAGRTVGVGKSATIYSVRVTNGSGAGSFSAFLAGVDYVYRRNIRPAVANLSIGGSVMKDPTGATALETGINNLIASGVTCVVAAPDADADASTESPSRVANCITVGTVGRDNVTGKDQYVFGGFGLGVDLYAPGLGVCAAVSDLGNPGANPTALRNIGGGTSTAVPLVTGVVAMYLQAFPGATPSDISTIIRSNATRDLIINLPTGTK